LATREFKDLACRNPVGFVFSGGTCSHHAANGALLSANVRTLR
jgi:hypothetical protein